VERVCQNLIVDGRSRTSAANGQRGGRARIRMDYDKWSRLAFNGASERDIARALGISLRTLKRRKVDKRVFESAECNITCDDSP
jgi:hypothetical protein